MYRGGGGCISELATVMLFVSKFSNTHGSICNYIIYGLVAVSKIFPNSQSFQRVIFVLGTRNLYRGISHGHHRPIGFVASATINGKWKPPLGWTYEVIYPYLANLRQNRTQKKHEKTSSAGTRQEVGHSWEDSSFFKTLVPSLWWPL